MTAGFQSVDCCVLIVFTLLIFVSKSVPGVSEFAASFKNVSVVHIIYSLS